MKSIVYKRYILSGLLSLLMVCIAELLGEKEIIFPEITALVIGAWISPRQPWRVSKMQLVALMTVSAVAGVCIVRYLPVPLFVQAGIAFLFVGVSLLLCRSTLAPMLSACILPILLRTTSWIYPASVCGATLLIAVGRWLMERRGMVELPPAAAETPLRGRVLHWMGLWGLYLALSAIPVLTGRLYLMAPPLLVFFVEISNPQSGLRAKKWNVLALVAYAAVLGSGSKWLFADVLHLPVTFSALITILLLFVALDRTGLLMPPVGAIAFLPLILPAQGLWHYPLEVCAGVLVFTAVAVICFPQAKPHVAAQEQKADTGCPEEKQSV